MSEPLSLIEKLGIPEEGTVVVLDDDGELFKKLTISAPPRVTLQRRIIGSKVDMIIIRTKGRVDYKQLFERLKKAVKPDGKLWVVIPNNIDTTKKSNIIFVSAKDAKLQVGDRVNLNEEEQAVQLLPEKEKS
ncbi:MAG: hypothetical protein IIB41_03905 [Candidatus Marinimicrobia bacterium]|nr:hypothetical protein [Candidatus Neomarinimicrobiota bacterium]